MKYMVRSVLVILIYMGSYCVYAISNPLLHLDSTRLATSKKMITSRTASKESLAAYKKLLQQAEELLKGKMPTVMDKTILPPTKDKHDYLSISRYWWPNEDTADGLPWVRHDGETNPDTQTAAVDRKRLGFMGKSIWKLSLAYYFTDDEKYASRAINMLKIWFINPETLMNPHLEFAQSVPGNPNNRPFGILDGRSIVNNIPDAINLLSVSKHWNKDYQTKMIHWFTDYLKWLTESEIGIQGSLLKNNHGSWYKYQVASLAYYLGEIELTKNTVVLAQKSLDDMLNDEGGQIHELARTKSFFYSCLNLQALSSIAELGDKVGMDMWHYESDNKKSLSLALNYLIPVVEGEKWPIETLKPVDITGLVPIISKLAFKYKTRYYKKLLSNILEKNIHNSNLQEYWLVNSNF
ncbi:alginate lyase family protein [Aurantibacter sp.]|uniref:alginate lyase family protein n=1 Tax=Aurantibacter sp. TaxID=2807103 RepID=UPI0032654EB7